MAHIKTLKNNELIGGQDNSDVYPITSSQAIFRQNPDGSIPEGILHQRLEESLQDHEADVKELHRKLNDIRSGAAKVGYYECSTQGSSAAKAISADNYVLSTGGSMKVKMVNANTADNATLNINNTGAKPLYYAGERASANNSWEDGETVDVYYDGINFYATSVAGGGKFSTGEKLKEVGIDDEPTAGSNNLVKSGGVVEVVYDKIEEDITETQESIIDSAIINQYGRVVNSDYVVWKVYVYYFNNPTRVLINTWHGSYSVISNIPIAKGSQYQIISTTTVDGRDVATINVSAGTYIGLTVNTEVSGYNAVIKEISYVDKVNSCVQVKEQTFTAEEKNIARNNIGVPSTEYVNESDNALYAEIDKLKEEMQNRDKTSIIMVDLMQKIKMKNQVNSIDIMDVISSTSSSITLQNASAFVGRTPAVVKFPNEIYKIVYFEEAVGNTITRCAFESTDLTTAVSIQSVHDSLPSGQGQHLSAYGYLAMGHLVAEEIHKRASRIDDNFINGINFTQAAVAESWENTDEYNSVKDANGNIICHPTFSSNWLWGGHTQNGNNLDNKRGVIALSVNTYCGWSQKAYSIKQGNVNAYVEFEFAAKGTGFIAITAGYAKSRITSDGTAKMELYIDGVLTDTTILTDNKEKYIYDNKKVNSKIKLRVSLLEQKDTEIAIYSILFYSLYPTKNISISNNTNIAVLGDSWTQFPTVNSVLIPDYEFNELVIRPDGTTGDGYGYFPKMLKEVLGCNIDNWGKSNMTTEDYALPNIDRILAFKKYDYLIIEFFTNDRRVMTKEEWKNNLITLCDKCKDANVRPIIIMPCGTCSESQTVFHGEWFEYIIDGLNSN